MNDPYAEPPSGEEWVERMKRETANAWRSFEFACEDAANANERFIRAYRGR